jgi:hypothetical protein
MVWVLSGVWGHTPTPPSTLGHIRQEFPTKDKCLAALRAEKRKGSNETFFNGECTLEPHWDPTH